ncbi:hypothetical protein Tco_0484145 [Tanacetum coccineum]
MSQRREQEAILLQEQAVEEKQELLAEEQAANPFEPSPVSYFYNADYDNISTPSTTYTIHLTKSATIITNPSELTRQLLSNDPLSLPENESFHFDRYYVPSSPRPPEKPPDDDDVYFDIEPDTGVFTKVVDDISDNSTRELYVHVPNVFAPPTTPFSNVDTCFHFTPENEDKGPMKIYDEGHILSWMFHFSISILLDQLKIAPDFEASRARGFVLRSLELQSFA